MNKLTISLITTFGALAFFASTAFADTTEFYQWGTTLLRKTKVAQCYQYTADGQPMNDGATVSADLCRQVDPTTFQLRQSVSGGKLCYEMTKEKVPVVSELNNFGAQYFFVDNSNCEGQTFQ